MDKKDTDQYNGYQPFVFCFGAWAEQRGLYFNLLVRVVNAQRMVVGYDLALHFTYKITFLTFKYFSSSW